MKKIIGILLTAWLAIHLAGCGAPTATMTPPIVVPATEVAAATPSDPETAPETASETASETAPETATPTPAVVEFADPVLEAMIRGVMGKQEGDITVAEAEAVTRLNLSVGMQKYIYEEATIENISGLERFLNLESLDLSFHTISDITPLEGLTKLRVLSLGGNPVSDISPLAGLTNLKGLILTNCTAHDYGVLANLANLEFLMLDHSTITDLSPLGSLMSLKYLYLAKSPINDYSPLAEIYPNLEQKDFILATTLEELGFSMDNNSQQAWADTDGASIRINHDEWGLPPTDGDRNCVWVTMYLEGDYKMAVGFYPDLDAYVFQMWKDGEMKMNYVYNSADTGVLIGDGERQSSEQLLRAALPGVEAEDLLLAPIPIFNDTIVNAFNMSAAALYALPFEPITLKSLGFFPDEANAVCLYEQRGERDYNIEIHRPEWGFKEYDVRFFTPLSDEFRIVITYDMDDKTFVAGVDDNDGGGASFEYYVDTDAYIDVWGSYKDMTVREYFIKAYNDPEIEDVYLHSIELMRQYFYERFGMSFEELYTLPTCK